MPNARDVHMEVERLTALLIELSLCDNQNFPKIVPLGNGKEEVVASGTVSSNSVLKETPYEELYEEFDLSGSYNMKMLDGALIQLTYLFLRNNIIMHRLAFWPSPNLEKFQNNPEIYLQDEIYGDIVKRNIVPFPLRFDFDIRDGVPCSLAHPSSHLTLGEYTNCRIPVSGAIGPGIFVNFLLRNFYNTAYRKYDRHLDVGNLRFARSITNEELKILHIGIPH